MELFIVTIFEFCVEVMRASANLTGLSYKEVNTIVFLPVSAHRVLTTEESIPPEIPTIKAFGLNEVFSQ